MPDPHQNISGDDLWLSRHRPVPRTNFRQRIATFLAVVSDDPIARADGEADRRRREYKDAIRELRESGHTVESALQLKSEDGAGDSATAASEATILHDLARHAECLRAEMEAPSRHPHAPTMEAYVRMQEVVTLRDDISDHTVDEDGEVGRWVLRLDYFIRKLSDAINALTSQDGSITNAPESSNPRWLRVLQRQRAVAEWLSQYPGTPGIDDFSGPLRPGAKLSARQIARIIGRFTPRTERAVRDALGSSASRAEALAYVDGMRKTRGGTDPDRDEIKSTINGAFDQAEGKISSDSRK